MATRTCGLRLQSDFNRRLGAWPLLLTGRFITVAGRRKAIRACTRLRAGTGCLALPDRLHRSGHYRLGGWRPDAFYQIGYGIAAFGVGPLQSWAGLELSTIYGGTAIIAFAMAALSFLITAKAAARLNIPFDYRTHQNRKTS